MNDANDKKIKLMIYHIISIAHKTMQFITMPNFLRFSKVRILAIHNVHLRTGTHIIGKFVTLMLPG